MLGAFVVRRPDGSDVDDSAWRTGKTMDLLRLLALNNGRSVRTDAILEKLWPNVSSSRGKASLRTAASQIRKAVGHDCISRTHEGLLLHDAWVDTEEFQSLANQSHWAVQDSDPSRVLELATAAETLYREDFHAYADLSTWAQEERDHLTRKRLRLLTESGEAAMELGRFLQAIELANTAIRLDWSSERPHRVLMRAHAERGEIDRALRFFEGFQARLASELGAAPSSETATLQLTLLRGQTRIPEQRVSPTR